MSGTDIKSRLTATTTSQGLTAANSSRVRGGRGFCRDKRDVLAALIACIGALSMGMALGYTNPALQDKDLLLVLQTTEQQTWFASLLALGAIFGGPLAGSLVSLCGRKLTLMICNVPMGIGWFMITCGYHPALMYFGRIVTGLGSGLVALAVSLYITEIASKERRGVIGSGFQLFVSIGILVVYCFGIPFSWNWLAVLCLSVSCLNIFLLLIVPESPRWLAMNKRRLEAIEALNWLADDNTDAEAEYREMEKSFGSQTNKSISIKDFALPNIYKPALISFGMMFFQQTSGINVVIFYSSEIFATAGFASDPKIPTIVLGAFLALATAVSCVLMDRLGRRLLLGLSSLFMTISITTLGVYFYVIKFSNIDGLKWMALGSVLIYVVFFSLGWGPIPWLIIPEINATHARGLVSGLATCVVWTLLFLTTKEFERLKLLLNDYGSFWLFGGFCLLSCIFVWLCVPETKGQSLEEIQERFAGVSSKIKDICLEEVNQPLAVSNP